MEQEGRTPITELTQKTGIYILSDLRKGRFDFNPFIPKNDQNQSGEKNSFSKEKKPCKRMISTRLELLE